jgi:hypothetical protein
MRSSIIQGEGIWNFVKPSYKTRILWPTPLSKHAFFFHFSRFIFIYCTLVGSNSFSIIFFWFVDHESKLLILKFNIRLLQRLLQLRKENRKTKNVYKSYHRHLNNSPKSCFHQRKRTKNKSKQKIGFHFTQFTHADVERCRISKYLCRCWWQLYST